MLDTFLREQSFSLNYSKHYPDSRLSIAEQTELGPSAPFSRIQNILDPLTPALQLI